MLTRRPHLQHRCSATLHCTPLHSIDVAPHSTAPAARGPWLKSLGGRADDLTEPLCHFGLPLPSLHTAKVEQELRSAIAPPTSNHVTRHSIDAHAHTGAQARDARTQWDVQIAKDIVDTFFETSFEGGRHSDRIKKISGLDKS